MTSISYPFIDLAVLDGVREHLAAGNGVLVLSENLDEALLANSAGALLAGFEGPFDIVGENPQLGISAERQIKALDLVSNPGRSFSIGLRLSGGVESRMVMASVASVRLPAGERAVVLSWPTGESAAEAIIRDMADDNTHFAVFDDAGDVLAASSGFANLGLSEFDIAQLCTEAGRETDRMVKRRLKSGNSFIPVGIGRLRDDPALYILLAIAASQKPSETPAPGSPAAIDQFEPAAIAPSVGEGDGRSAPLEVQTDVLDDVDPVIHQSDMAASDIDIDDANPVIAPGTAQQSSEPHRDEPVAMTVEAASQPVRFTWKIGMDGKFSFVSPELAEAIGKNAADVTGRSFQDVARVFAFDHSGEISDLLARRDTWSGRSVLWPVEGTDMRVPVDLAALPVYDRDRNFEGFKGFGVVRLGDAIIDPEGLGLALGGTTAKTNVESSALPAPETDPFQGEVPAIAGWTPAEPPVAPAVSDDTKVVRLGDHRLSREKTADVPEKSQLSPVERNAFREIADRLRRDGLALRDETHADIPEPLNVGPVDDIASTHTEDLPSTSLPESLEDLAQETLDSIPANTASVEQASLNVVTQVEDAHSEDLSDVDDDPDYRLPFDGDIEAAQPKNIDDAPILSKLPVPILIHNGESLLYGNPAFFELTHYASLDALEQEGGIEHLLHVTPTSADSVPSSRIVTADNDEKPVHAHLHSVRWKGEHALLLSLRPLEEETKPDSESTQTIERLEREVTELSSVLETATDGVVFVNTDGTIRSINQSAEALFGFDPAVVQGKPFTYLLATESQRAANDYIANLAGTGVASLINDGREVIGREAHGRFIPLFMTIGKLDFESGYCIVLRDITQWKRAEEDLNAAKRAAEHASTQKSEFLARVSHEIRTPLNAIIGFSEMMSEERFGPVGNARYLDYLNDINRSGRHVLDLVNDLLDISKIEAGQQEMNFESVGLNEALAEAVSIMQPQANRDRVIIRSSFATDLPDVVADLRSIKQIALNLLANAVRYTGPGGQVIVSTSYEITGGVAIRVRDTGVGMSAKDIEQALKPFKQINTLKRERGDGTGLGLPLTKAMVEANRASFAISSTPGQGTLIEITFPSTRVLAE